MKRSNSQDLEEDQDSFNLNLWRATKRRQEHQTQAIVPSKTSSLDGKKTVKYTSDPVMENLITSILRESDRFPEDNDQAAMQDLNTQQEIMLYEPNTIKGIITNPHICSQIQKEQYGLEDEGSCLQFDLNETTRVLVVGKIGYLPAEGIQAHLYIPTNIAKFLFLKEAQRKETALPERLRFVDGKFTVLIQRKANSSQNILDYPYFVIDPKNLVYPTYLCSWIDCKRRLTLINFFQDPKQVNEHTVFGNTCHRLLEWLSTDAMTAQEYFDDSEGSGQKLYQSMLYDMFLVGKSFSQFWQTCKARLDNIASFFKRFISNSEELEVDRYRKLSLKINKIIESQIMLRSYTLGLKGKIDLLLFGELIDRKKQSSTPVYIPMELKSGRRVSDSHKRQTDIYNILVRQQHKHPTIGLLYYSDSDIKFFRHQDPIAAFQIIVVHRNIVAQNLVRIFQEDENPKLPCFPQSFSQCNYCNLSEVCELSYREQQRRENKEAGQEVPSKYNQTIKDSLSGISKAQEEYMVRWFKMLYKEERQVNNANEDNLKKGIFKFTTPSSVLPQLHTKTPSGKIRLSIFHQCRNLQDLSSFTDFYKPSLKMRCCIPEISLLENCKVFETLAQNLLFKVIIQFNSSEIKYNRRKVKYCIEESVECNADIETFSSQLFPALRTTIFSLLKSNHFIKNIVLDSNRHEAAEAQTQQSVDCDFEEEIVSGLNRDQFEAFSKATSESQFCLIEGMPGTGKTELIIRLIQYYCQKGARILVTTFTNRALDNILQRIADSQRVDSQLLIRQGSQFSAPSHLQKFTSRSQTFKTTEDYLHYFSKKRAWFVTISSLSIHHLPDQFDVVILDEASQCLEPSCIEALLRGKKFILIGDYLQLQPLVRSKQAAKQGMSLSLFQRLCQLRPHHLVSLKKQYRMNQKIMSLSNQLVYKGRLELGQQKSRNKQVELRGDWRNFVPHSFQEAISPAAPIVFINYDPILLSLSKKYQSRQGEIRKVIEAELPAFIANLFRKLEVPSASLAIITALNISVSRITELLTCQVYRQNSVLTIDRSQGIDREVVILLIERGNEELVQNPRRLNVALTRAKSKLIVVGSERHLERMKVWEGNLARLLKEYQLELTKAMISDMIKGLS